MLKQVYIDNDRCLSNFSWEPPALSLLEGANGSGKSSLLHVLWKLRTLAFGGQPAAAVFPLSHLTRWDKRLTQSYELAVEVAGTRVTYRLEIDHEWKKPRVMLERLATPTHLLFEFIKGEVHLFEDDGKKGPTFSGDWDRSVLASVPAVPRNRTLTAFKQWLGRMCLAAPLAPLMVADSRTERMEPDLHLADFVSWYRVVSGDAVRLHDFTDAVRASLPGFRGLRLDAVGKDAKELGAVFGDGDGGSGDVEFSFDELSDGQRTLIALHALLYLGPLGSGLLCLDEPDNFVALAEVQPVLRLLEDRVRATQGQVIVASHHPEVINRLWSGHGFVLERGPLQPARIRAAEPVEGIPPSSAVAMGTT